jgi:hypothetical protein
MTKKEELKSKKKAENKKTTNEKRAQMKNVF